MFPVNTRRICAVVGVSSTGTQGYPKRLGQVFQACYYAATSRAAPALARGSNFAGSMTARPKSRPGRSEVDDYSAFAGGTDRDREPWKKPLC